MPRAAESFTARGWLSTRSRLQAYQTQIRWSWCVAGIWDDLRLGNPISRFQQACSPIGQRKSGVNPLRCQVDGYLPRSVAGAGCFQRHEEEASRRATGSSSQSGRQRIWPSRRRSPRSSRQKVVDGGEAEAAKEVAPKSEQNSDSNGSAEPGSFKVPQLPSSLSPVDCKGSGGDLGKACRDSQAAGRPAAGDRGRPLRHVPGSGASAVDIKQIFLDVRAELFCGAVRLLRLQKAALEQPVRGKPAAFLLLGALGNLGPCPFLTRRCFGSHPSL